MAETLSILKTYNCRVEAGVVRRGRVLDDWMRYGLYYGGPANLRVHDFSNWNILVFDYAAIELGTDPTDYPGTDIYLYIPFADKFAIAAMSGGYLPPLYNAVTVAALREKNHRKIDEIMAAGFAGIFWDTCDTGYWDWSYSLESTTILKNQLQEYCDYVRTRGGKSFVNGTPYYIDCGEMGMLESFLATWSHNEFAPDWGQMNFFIQYTFGLEDTGIYGGIPWSTGIYYWLYAHKYAPDVQLFAHSYGSPESIYQHEKQLFSLAGALSIGLNSWNYIEPTNQTLIKLWAHSFYIGVPLECPQIDCLAKTASRRHTGAAVSFNESTGTGTIDMNVEPDYWWNTDQAFEDINFEVDGAQVTGAEQSCGFFPNHLRVNNFYFYDDRTEVYFRLHTIGTFPETDILPFFFYIGLDQAAAGYDTGRDLINNIPWMHFNDLKAQIYLYGKSVFYWKAGKWEYLYPARYEIIGNYIYYAIRKETLRFVAPGWDETTIRTLPIMMYGDKSNTYFANPNHAVKAGCLPTASTMQYNPEYIFIGWVDYNDDLYYWDAEREWYFKKYCSIPYENCDMPGLGASNELDYNQLRVSDTTYSMNRNSVGQKVKWYSYSCIYNFTIYGYARCTCKMVDDVYAPHCAVTYYLPGQVNKRVSQVTITGNFDKAWIFDRETAKFVGPDDTPDTHYTASPFSPTKIIDGQDICVAIANDETSETLDTWTVTDVQVTLVDWASTHDPGYDIGLPDLLEWQSIYEDWKGTILAETIENTYQPSGMKRGGINIKKDSVKNIFTVAVASSGPLVEALETYDITNATLIMRRTYDDLDKDDPDSTDTIVWAYVDSWELTDEQLVIRAKLNFHNWGATFPKRRASYFCPFVFKGPQCDYGGAAIACDKTLTTCKGLGNETKFGGISTLPRLQRGKWS